MRPCISVNTIALPTPRFAPASDVLTVALKLLLNPLSTAVFVGDDTLAFCLWRAHFFFLKWKGVLSSFELYDY